MVAIPNYLQIHSFTWKTEQLELEQCKAAGKAGFSFQASIAKKILKWNI